MVRSDIGNNSTGRMVMFADFSPPKFDIGISPTQKENFEREEDSNMESQLVVVNHDCEKRQIRLGEKLRSPYVQRAVTFEVTTDEKRVQDWILKGFGGCLETVFI